MIDLENRLVNEGEAAIVDTTTAASFASIETLISSIETGECSCVCIRPQGRLDLMQKRQKTSGILSFKNRFAKKVEMFLRF